MKCKTFLKLLDSDALEGREDAARHAEDCQSCRAALGRWESAKAALSGMEQEETPPFLHERIMATVRAEAGSPAPQSSRFFLLRPAWALPALAVLLMALVGGPTLVWLVKRPSGETALPLPKPTVQAPLPATERQEGNKTKAQERENLGTGFTLGGTLKDDNALPPPTRPEVRLRKEPPLEVSPDLTEVKKKEAPSERRAPLFLGGPEPAQEAGSADASSSPQPESVPEKGQARSKSSEEEAATQARASSPAPVEKPAYVLCTLTTLDGGRYYAFQLPAASAPASSLHWFITVDEDGSVRGSDERGRSLGLRLPPVLEALSHLHLPPGRYKMSRLGG